MLCKATQETERIYVQCVGLQMDGALDMAGLSAQTPVLSCNYPFDLNRPLAI